MRGDAYYRWLQRFAFGPWGNAEAMNRLFYEQLRRGGWTDEAIQRMGNMLDVRRFQRAGFRPFPRVFPTRAWWSNPDYVSNIRYFAGQRNRHGFFGAGPSRIARGLSRPMIQQLLNELGTRGSPQRRELAAFIRLMRNNPEMAARVRAAVAQGRASASVRFVGGQMSRRAGMRAAFGFMGRLAGMLNPVVATLTAIAFVVAIGFAISGSAEDDEREKLAASINCDCPNVGGGMLDVGWIPDCRKTEESLIALAEQGELVLEVNEGRISGGNLCGSIAGPEAWPSMGELAKNPNAKERDTESCTGFSGLVRRCDDRD